MKVYLCGNPLFNFGNFNQPQSTNDNMSTDLEFHTDLLLECMPTAVFHVNMNGCIKYLNAAACEALNLSRENAQGLSFHSLQWELFNEAGELISSEAQPVFRSINSHVALRKQIVGVRDERSMRWYTVDVTPMLNEMGRCIGVIACYSECEHTVADQDEVSNGKEHLRILIENLDAVIWESDVDSETFSYISPKVEDLFGYKKEEWLNKGFWQSIVFEEDRQTTLDAERRHIESQQTYELEYRILHKQGFPIWVSDRVEVHVYNGAAQKVRGFIQNVDARRRAELELATSQRKYKSLMEEAPFGIAIYDKDGLLKAANARCAEIWRVSLEEYIDVFNLLKSDLMDNERYARRIEGAFNGERGEVTIDIDMPFHDNIIRTFKIKYYPLLSTGGILESVVYMIEDVTNYREAEQKTEQQELLKQSILDALDEAILVIDGKGNVLNMNNRLLNYVEKQSYDGLSIGESVFPFINSFEENQFLKENIKSVLGNKAKYLNHEVKLADGNWYSLRVTPLTGKFGAVISWQNIDTRKEIEMALERSLRKYRNIYNRAPVMMHSINRHLEIISVSDYWLENMGYERNEVIGKSSIDFMEESSLNAVTTDFRSLFSRGELRNAEYKYVKKSGEVMDVLLSAVAEYDENGNFERSITGMVDITDLKVAERRLQESQAKLLESQRISKLGNYELDLASGDFSPSAEMSAMLGLKPGEDDLCTQKSNIHPDDLQEYEARLEHSLRDGVEFFSIYRAYHKHTRALKWISGRGRMVKDQTGKTVKMIGTVQDITEQKVAEEKIRRLTDRVLLATEIAHLGVWEYDKETKETVWEDQMYAIFPQFKSPPTLYEIKDLFLAEDKHVVDAAVQQVREGVSFFEIDGRVVVGGAVKYLRGFTRVLKKENGEVKGMVGVIYDITQDKKLQKKLEASLEEKNVLIKEVHHRVKNNMQLISSILALKAYDLKDLESKAIFNEVNQRIKAMSVIHDKLYTFYNVSEIDIKEYLENIGNELQILIGTPFVRISVHAISVIMDVDKALLIGLMVSELVANATKHGFDEHKKGLVEVVFHSAEGNHVLKVLNNGDTIPKDALETSTGLGMSLIKTFVKQIGGEVSIDEQNGFKVDF